MEGEAAPATSIAARIAALKLNQVHGGQQSGTGHESNITHSAPDATSTSLQSSLAAPAKRPRPPPPPTPSRPGLYGRTQTTNLPATARHDIGNQPAGLSDTASLPTLPRRPASSASKVIPLLPPRSPSSNNVEARTSNRGPNSDHSRIRAPPYDPSKLPPTPVRNVSSVEVQPRPPLPERNSSTSSASVRVRNHEDHTTDELVPTSSQAPHPPRRSALSFGFDNKAVAAPPIPSSRPSMSPSNHVSTPNIGNGIGTPPPLPKSSKPKPGTAVLPATTTSQISPQPRGCLKCRDFSAPDAHAARFPRQDLPSTDLGWLAQQLVDPFDSLTDRARVIFVWLHHNIDYDTNALYNDCVQPSTPASTLSSGMAVCEGYAGLFNAIALKAGLESIVIGGHGKGVGYATPPMGQPLPSFKSTHAWNAVRIDGGQWKLIDPCWGAGQVGGWGKPYKRNFAPINFVADNTAFGQSHFPSETSRQFREDGRTISWEEYLLGDRHGGGPHVYGGYVDEEGVAKHSFQPAQPLISLGALTDAHVRFQFNRVCEHWDPVRNGKGEPFCYVLELEPQQGKRSRTPFEHNGYHWWADVPRTAVGMQPYAGATVKIAAITQVNGQDARGLTAAGFREKDGRAGMAWGYVAKWDVAE